jgi:hypothetical protein
LSTVPKAVIMMTGTAGWWVDAWRSTSMPSTRGILRSVMMTSTGWPRASMASAPSAACTTS